jgi:peptidoglycan hydrolase CwlO-like protein
MKALAESPSRRRSALAPALIAVACLSGVLAVTSAGAQSVSELNSQISSAKTQADKLGSQISAEAAQLQSAQAQAAAAAARESQLTSLLANGEQRAAALEAQVNQARAGLASARTQLRRAVSALSERLVSIYEAGPADPTEMLLTSKGFDDLANRADLLGRIQQADNALAVRVRALKQAVAARLASVSAAHSRAVAYNRQVAAARTQISAVRAQAEATATSLAAARQQAQSSLSSLQSQMSDWQQQVEQAQQVSAQQAQTTVSSWVGKWAIPEAIVMCESGGNFRAVNPGSGAGGAYQIMPSTWRLYGQSGLPENASPGLQSRIAAQIWADSGPAAWECSGMVGG